MSSKRPPAIQEKAYVEIDLDLLKETGEIKIVGSPIIAPTVTSKVPRGKFEITYTAELFNLLEKLGNKKIKVFSYLLDHKDGNNSINTSVRKLSNEIGVSNETVAQTLRMLKASGLLVQNGSIYMFSPGLMVKGNQMREAYLMRKYEEISQQGYEAYEEAVDVDISPQLEFNEKGQIIQRAIETKGKRNV